MRWLLDTNLNCAAEKAKLQAAMASGVRLAYELANIKRQVEKIWAAEGEQIESPMVNDVAA